MRFAILHDQPFDLRNRLSQFLGCNGFGAHQPALGDKKKGATGITTVTCEFAKDRGRPRRIESALFSSD